MPGIVRDPLYYDMGILLIPLSFLVVAVLAGGMATVLKKMAGVDFRGRRLELVAVLATALVSMISIGLLRSFFGTPDACHGYFGHYHVTQNDLSSTYFLQLAHHYFFAPYASLCRYVDATAKSHVPAWTRLCGTDMGCFSHLGAADASYYLDHDSCAGDLLFVGFLYLLSVVTYIGLGLHKHRERRQRRQRHIHVD